MEELEIKKQSKLLIIAPHPDDEIIGCGGLISVYGKQSDVLLLTDGCKGHRIWSDSRTKRIRMKEFENVMKASGIRSYRCLNVTDRELYKRIDCYRKINLSNYDYVFVPNRTEEHPDHRASARQLMFHIITTGYKGLIFQYEVWTPLTRPSHILDISQYMEKKIELLKGYKSQIDELNYIDAIVGLNQYRGVLNHLLYAECYKKGIL